MKMNVFTSSHKQRQACRTYSGCIAIIFQLRIDACDCAHALHLFDVYISLEQSSCHVSLREFSLSRASVPAETPETSLLLIRRNHTSTLRCIDSFQHGHYLIHLRSFVRVCIPADFHHICQRAWAASWDLWSQVLQFCAKFNFSPATTSAIIFKEVHTCRTTADVISEKLRSGYGMSQQYISHRQMPKL